MHYWNTNSIPMEMSIPMALIDKKIKDCFTAFRIIDKNANQLSSIDNNESLSIHISQSNNEEGNQIDSHEGLFHNSPSIIHYKEKSNQNHCFLSPVSTPIPFNEIKFKNTLFYQAYPMNGRNSNAKVLSIIKNADQTQNKHLRSRDLITESTVNTTGGKSKYRLTQSSRSICQLSKKEESNYNENIMTYTYDNNNDNGTIKNHVLTFKPKHNRRQCKDNLSSKERLLKKKTHYYKSQSYISKLPKSPYRQKSIGEIDKGSDVGEFIRIYTESIKKDKEKEAKVKIILSQRTKDNEKENIDQYAFRNGLNKKTQIYEYPRYNTPSSFNNYLLKNKDYSNKSKQKLNELTTRMTVIDNQLHTFTPVINKKIKRDNKKLIIRQIPFVNDYVKLMRRFRERSKSKSKSFDDSRSNSFSSEVFNVSKRKFPVSKDKTRKLKEIKDINYYRSISMKEIIDNRFKYGIEDYFYNERQLFLHYNDMHFNPYNNNEDEENRRKDIKAIQSNYNYYYFLK